jgi:hypothetical protein
MNTRLLSLLLCLAAGIQVGRCDESSLAEADSPVAIWSFEDRAVSSAGGTKIDGRFVFGEAGTRPVPLTDGGTPIARLFPTA